MAGSCAIAPPTARASRMPSPRMVRGATLPKSSGPSPTSSCDQFGVPVVGAGREHHGPARLHRAGRALGAHADHGAGVVGEQLGHPVLEAQLDRRLAQHPGEEARDDAGAERQPVGHRGLAARPGRQAERLDAGLLAGLGLVDVAQPPALHEHLRVGGADREVRAHPQLVAPVPQLGGVDRLVGQVAALGERPVGLVVVVGQPRDHGPADRADVLPVADGVRRDLQPRRIASSSSTSGWEWPIARTYRSASSRCRPPCLRGRRRGWPAPDLAAGVRGGTAEQLPGLEDGDLLAPQRGTQCRGQARQSRPDDDHVAAAHWPGRSTGVPPSSCSRGRPG